MKKIYLLSFALFSVYTAVQAQSVEIKDQTNNNTIVANNAVITNTTAAGAQTANTFQIKNISTSTQTFVVKMMNDVVNTVNSSDMAESSFCTGTTCYPPTTFSATVVLAPNATSILAADLLEASVVGMSQISYKVYISSNTTDAVGFTLKYNGSVSVKNLSSLFTSVSEVYPNPSSSKSFISMSVNKNISNVELTVINSLGSIVSTKFIDLETGKNVVSLDSDNLPTGLYFITVNQGNQRVTKKLTISK